MRHRRGTTLIETLVSTGIFAILVLATFIFFDMGRIKWAWMNLTRKLGTDARTAMGSLVHDLRRTNYSSVDIYTNPRIIPPGWTDPTPRWAICMVSADDPLNSNNFDPVSGEPIWNKYIVYMATMQTNQGNESGIGGAGSGLFLRIVATFNATATTRLPLHNKAFRTEVDMINLNEYALTHTRRIKAMASPLPLQFAGLHFPDSWVAINPPSDTPSPGSPSFRDPAGPPPLSPPSDPAVSAPEVDTANTDVSAGNVTQAESDVFGVIKGTLPPGSTFLKSVHITTVSNVFALLFSKNDTQHTIGITFKDRGYASRRPSGVNGYSARQMDMTVACQYVQSK